MVLKAYFDDSGSEPQSEYFTIGGFLADTQQWDALSTEWDSLLRKAPALDYFKMSEAWNLRKQFSGQEWDADLRDQRVSGFVALIQKYGLLGISATIKWTDWAEILKPLPAVKRTLATDNPYDLLAWRVVLSSAVLSKELGLGTDCHYIFDEQGKFNESLHYSWKYYLQAAERGGFGPWMTAYPSFQDELRCKPLQVADLYAWLIRRGEMSRGPLSPKIHLWLQQAKANPSCNDRFYRTDLRSLRRVHEIVRLDLIKAGNNFVVIPANESKIAARKARKKGPQNSFSRRHADE